MNGATGSTTKWTAARAAIDQVTARYEDVVELGLAMFPYPDGCGPGRLEVAPAFGTGDAIHSALMPTPPSTGAFTPLGETLLGLADEPSLIGGAGPAHVVVITDGYQWCDPYDPDARTLPLAGVEELNGQGVKTFVVGFGGGVDVEILDQMAVRAGTARPGCEPFSDAPGARCYYQADDAGALLAALMDIAAETADEACDGLDNDCDGLVDEGACAVPGVDGGVDAPTGADAPGLDDAPGLPGGCGCGASRVPAAGDVSASVVTLLALAVLARRRRVRARR